MLPLREQPDALAYHVMLRLDDGRLIAPTGPLMRATARVIYEQGATRGLIAFRVVDTHVHAIVAASRRVAGRFANYTATSLGWRLGLPVAFDHARIRPICTQSHLERAFAYVLRQAERHGTHLDPAHEGSSVPDLVGLRIPPNEPWRLVHPLMPRLNPSAVLSLIGWSGIETWPLRFEHLLGAVVGAGAMTTAVGRRSIYAAAVHLGRDALDPSELAAALKIPRLSVQRLAALSPRPSHRRAVELQLRLRGRVFASVRSVPPLDSGDDFYAPMDQPIGNGARFEDP